MQKIKHTFYDKPKIKHTFSRYAENKGHIYDTQKIKHTFLLYQKINHTVFIIRRNKSIHSLRYAENKAYILLIYTK